MLFQASALAHVPMQAPSRALTAPALGRVAAVEVTPEELERPDSNLPLPIPEAASHAALGFQEPVSSFWPLVKVEAAEALLLLVVQALALALPAWAVGVSPARLLAGAWPLVLPYLLSVSWILFMAPMVLTGQTPLMASFGVTLPENTPERRITFSLVHMLSVLCFPLSFLCMVLSPRHRTLGELLSGLELLARPTGRMR